MDAHSEAEHFTRKVTESDETILRRRLWTPWRMKYVGGDAKEDGCIFCNRLAANNDVESLILRRGRDAFLIMNLFPYNTGHVMVVPNQHVADLDYLSEDALSEMWHFAVHATRAIRQALNPAGFNLGMNIGAVAGAGVADHLHEHIVPRWQGDANFMPILAGAVVMPELIPATYAKIRVELQRSDAETISLAIVTQYVDNVLVTDPGALPAIELIPNEPASKTATRFARSLVPEAELIGWAGDTRANVGGEIALAFLALTSTQPTQGSWIDTSVALDQLRSEDDRLILANALKLDFTVIDAPPGEAVEA